MDYEVLVKALPKPETLEEQYLYALVCSVAEVEPQYGVARTEPFKRMEQYWKMFYKVAAQKFKDLETPAANTVNSAAIINKSVTVPKLHDDIVGRLLPTDTTGFVTETMLSSNVSSKLLGPGRVTEDMLMGSVAERLLGEERVTQSMLSTSVSSMLLGVGRVTESMLSNDVGGKLLGEKRVSKDMLSQEVQDILARVQ